MSKQLNYSLLGRSRSESLVDDCSSLTGWSDSASSPNCGISLSTENVLEGTNSIEFKCNAGTAVGNIARGLYTGMNWDWSDASELVLKIHFPITSENRLNDCYIAVLFGGTNIGTGYWFTGVMYNGNIKPDCDTVVLKLSADDFPSTSGAFDTKTDSINYLRVDLTQGNDGAEKIMYLDAIYTDLRPQTKVMLSNDDAHESAGPAYLQAVLAENDIKCTYFVNGAVVGTGVKMSVADLASLQDDGHLIANHTYDGTSLIGLSYEDQAQNWQDQDDWLAANGFIDGRPYFAFPQGTHDNNTIQMLGDKGVLLARGSYSGQDEYFLPLGSNPNHVGISNRYFTRAKSLGVGHYETASEALADVDLAIARGYSMHIYSHVFTVGAPGNSSEFQQSEMTALCEGLKIRQDKGLIDCVTFKEYVDGMEGVQRTTDFPPVAVG